VTASKYIATGPTDDQPAPGALAHRGDGVRVQMLRPRVKQEGHPWDGEGGRSRKLSWLVSSVSAGDTSISICELMASVAEAIKRAIAVPSDFDRHIE